MKKENTVNFEKKNQFTIILFSKYKLMDVKKNKI